MPPSGEKEPCPPCNPGFYNNDTAICSPCPPGTFSDGMKRTDNFLDFYIFLYRLSFPCLVFFCFCRRRPSTWSFHCVCPPACDRCPAGTEPTLGYEYKWWNILPANMKTSCFNVGNSKCDGMNGECVLAICAISLSLIGHSVSERVSESQSEAIYCHKIK